jgi:hypothetical protein
LGTNIIVSMRPVLVELVKLFKLSNGGRNRSRISGEMIQ